MARNVEGGSELPRRTRRAPFVVWGIIGSVLLVTASAVFGSIMYNWTHQPVYEHKEDVLVYKKEEVEISYDQRTYKPNARATDYILDEQVEDSFLRSDTEQTALMLERLDSLVETGSVGEGYAKLHHKYDVSVAALEALKGSKVTFSDPAFLSNKAEFSVDKGETQLAHGVYTGTRGTNTINSLTDDLVMVNAALQTSRRDNNGLLYMHYQGEDSSKGILEFIYSAGRFAFTYQEISTYYNTQERRTVEYPSKSVYYEVNFHGYFNVEEQAKA